MRLLYKGLIFESESKSPTGSLNEKYAKSLEEHSKLILNALVSAYKADNKRAHSDRFRLSDVLHELNINIPAELEDLIIGYSKDNGFYYHIMSKSGLNYPLIEIPNRIRETGVLYGRDYTGIAHELNHYYQDIKGSFDKDGYGIDTSNPENKIKGYDFGYANNNLEINSFLHEVQLYLKLNEAYANEVRGYDFGPFMEEIFEKFLKIPERDFNNYYNEVLDDDARQQISTTLYSIWKNRKK